MTYSKQMKRKLLEAALPHPPSYEDAVSPLASLSVTSPTNPQDIDLFSAAEALTRLNTLNGLVALTPHMLSRSPSVLSPTDVNQQVHPIVLLVNAMTRLPIVTNAVKYYETSKRNYATFNYAAAFVEKAAIPVFSKIEVNLNNIHQARQEKAKKKRRLDASNPKDKNETKKRLKFCLHVLKLANENISSKVSELQLRITESQQEKELEKEKAQNNANEKNGDRSKTPEVLAATPLKTTDVKPESASEKFEDNELTRVSSTVPEETNTEIVKTVKKIIHIISNFRPSSLNGSEEGVESAPGARDDDVKLKTTIRSIILNLPNQIQKANSGPLPCQDRVMEFARESLDMISLLTNVFNEQLQKAENWVDGPETVAADSNEKEANASEFSDAMEVISEKPAEKPI